MLSPSRSFLYITCHPAGPACLADGLKSTCAHRASITSAICFAIRELHSSEADISSDGSELQHADSGDYASSARDSEGRSNQSGPPSGAESSGDDGALAARWPGRRLRQNDIKPLRPAGEAQQEAAEAASMQRLRDDKGQTSRQHAEEPPARSPSLSSEEQGEFPRLLILLLACWQKDEELTAKYLLRFSGISFLVPNSLSSVIAPLCRSCDVDRSLLL